MDIEMLHLGLLTSSAPRPRNTEIEVNVMVKDLEGFCGIPQGFPRNSREK